nr:methylated-DNA--[protein]-cysteine S-methyltransferase [Cellulosimicrobium sp. MM]
MHLWRAPRRPRPLRRRPRDHRTRPDHHHRDGRHEPGRTTTLTTPDGPFTVVVDAGRRGPRVRLDDDPRTSSRSCTPACARDGLPRARRDPAVAAAVAAVRAYYAGDVHAIDAVPVRQASGPYRAHAWDVLRTVEPGDPVTYTRYAELSGRPAAVRAAAGACAMNAAALFVPCHRVLRTDGSLGGFRYGLDVKRSLLDREARATVSAPAR